MNKTAEKSNINLKKWAAIILVPLLLIAGVRLLLKSDWLFTHLQNIAEEQAGALINGTLHIEYMNGDLLKGLTMAGVVLNDAQGDVVARADSISLSYSVLSLFREPYSLERLTITNSQFFIRQGNDSLWNVQKLLPQSEVPAADTVPLKWAVDSLLVEKMNVTAESDQLFPDRFVYVDSLNTRLLAGVNSEGFFGEIDRLNFSLRDNRLPESISVYLAGSGSAQSYTLESLVMNTGRSLLSGEAIISQEKELKGDLELSPLSTRDINIYLDSLKLEEQDVRIKLGASRSAARTGGCRGRCRC